MEHGPGQKNAKGDFPLKSAGSGRARGAHARLLANLPNVGKACCTVMASGARQAGPRWR